MARVEVRGKEQLSRVAAVLSSRADGKSIRRRLSKTIRDESEHITREQRANLAEKMPHRGGLAALLSGQGSFTIRTTLAGRSAGVTIVDSWRGHNMKAVDAGAIRHPVFGRWLRGQAPQAVPAGQLSGPVLRNKRRLQEAIVADLDALAEEIAKET